LLNTAQIKNLLHEKNLCVKKRLGQNFLIDKNKRDNIIGLCAIKETDSVIEIGPGLGALTESIQPACKNLIVIEKDKGLCSILIETFQNNDNIDIINSDVLDYQIPKVKVKFKVIGNLPYYIASPIIFHMISQKHSIDSIFITVQKEVAQRIIARPGGKNYGLLSLGVEYQCCADILLDLPGRAFFPAPAVDSCFMRLSVRREPAVKVKNERHLFGIMKAGFNQRRKTLFNALRNSGFIDINSDQLEYAFSGLGISRNIRAEEMGLEEFAMLSDFLS
jgi:16S rRNA (adenine1518-N6/adenine1519-N6)-dimethyltransferase